MSGPAGGDVIVQIDRSVIDVDRHVVVICCVVGQFVIAEFCIVARRRLLGRDAFADVVEIGCGASLSAPASSRSRPSSHCWVSVQTRSRSAVWPVMGGPPGCKTAGGAAGKRSR